MGRLEKTVGWFVTLAALLMLAGLGYYIYNLAALKGWFLPKAPYFAYLQSGAGIKVGDKVKLMGFDAGEITVIKPEKPDSGENVYVELLMFGDNIGYVWDDSIVNVKSAGVLGSRYLEVTKGGTRSKIDLHATYKVEGGKITSVWSREQKSFTNWSKGSAPYELLVIEPPELSSQIDDMAQMLKVSLTNILQLTNALGRTLENAAEATSNANELLRDARPLIRNVTLITENLKEPGGSLGEWLIPTAMNRQLTFLLTNANSTVGNVNATVTNANTNLVIVFSNITASLENLASLTSNLNAQVQRNNNIVSSVSKLIVDTDDMVQGLKKHWLLRSAFKDEKNERGTAPRPKNSKGAGRE